MSYTIEAAEKQIREPEIKGERFHSYLLTLDGQKVEMLQKPTSPAPKVGEVIEGTIEPGKEKNDGSKWPDKFKRLRSIPGGGGFRPRDPKETNSIVRQHSQEMAIRWATLCNATGQKFQIDSYEELKLVIDWFQADVTAEAPVEPPTAIRDAAPTIPLDRAKTILEQARAAGHATGTELTPTLKAKLTAVGVKSGLISHLNVDQAEDVEGWLKGERRDTEIPHNDDEFLAKLP